LVNLFTTLLVFFEELFQLDRPGDRVFNLGLDAGDGVSETVPQLVSLVEKLFRKHDTLGKRRKDGLSEFLLDLCDIHLGLSEPLFKRRLFLQELLEHAYTLLYGAQ